MVKEQYESLIARAFRTRRKETRTEFGGNISVKLDAVKTAVAQFFMSVPPARMIGSGNAVIIGLPIPECGWFNSPVPRSMG